MRRRLSLVFLSLVAGVLLSIGIPLGVSYAETTSQEMYIDRSADADRFAQLATPAMARGELNSVRTELDSYEQLYGSRVQIYGSNGELLLTSGEPRDRATEDVEPGSGRTEVAAALAGRGSDLGDTVLPWRTAALTVASPVLNGRSVIGAVAITAPTDRARSAIVLRWSILAAAGVGSLLVAAVLIGPLSAWILRPIRRLDEAVHTVTEGDLSVRIAEDSGPPELRRLTAGFNAMAAAVSTSLAKQRALVADASHQLRNPLSTLRLRVEDLTDALNEEDRERGDRALEETDRLTQILDDTLAFARADDDLSTPIAADLREIVRDRVSAAMPLAGTAGVELSWAAERPSWVLAPSGAIEQVVDELLHNAIRFSPGAAVRVEVTQAVSAEVRLVVADEGPGMDDAQLASATQRFWRGADQQNVEGSGLGLSIVDVIVTRCAGMLTLHRRDPHGLLAEVILPALVGADLDDPAVRAEQPGNTPAPPDGAVPARS